MDLNSFNQSKYLAGRDLPEGGLDLTIASFDIVKMQDGTSKPIVIFSVPSIKPMILNKTNRMLLEVIFRSSQTESMIGQRVGVFFDRMVQGPNGDMVGGLRIRPAGATAQTQGFVPNHKPNPYRADLVAAAIAPRHVTQPSQPVAAASPAGPANPFDQEVPF